MAARGERTLHVIIIDGSWSLIQEKDLGLPVFETQYPGQCRKTFKAVLTNATLDQCNYGFH